LEKIKHEMRAPWADRRQPYESMTMDQAFTYLTGETDKTLYPGALVHARINKVMDKIMVLTIESGHLDAILTPPYRSDDPNAPQLTELFQPGTSQQFVIHNVDKTKFQVELSARQSDKSHAKDHIHNLYLDAYFSKSAMEEDMRHAQETEKKRQRIVEQTRVVPHPKFKMFNLKQALQHLQPLRPGALVIRPSSKGNDHLTITWKVAPDVYHHIDVEELEKPNAYTLGRRLRIAPYLPYADLDEIIVNHVGELSKRVKTLEDSNRFRNIDKLAMHDWLNARLASEGHNVVYGFCRYDNNRPLHYYLSWKYAPNKPCIDWLVVVERDCYKLRTIEYPDVTSLVAGFKKQATNEFQKAKETRDGRTAGWNVPVEQDKWRPPTDNWGAHSMTGGTSSGW
jgi:transcription elongation factor SPT6